ncbi:STM4014 family protein [Armatimonas sp.]|uniref:STM4014 family protein n=1 Tax=Armatimonas sp. TaxID=1872638 RepID=UPI00286B9172|nr:STM4014 family protein [Armatimonas sp.]
MRLVVIGNPGSNRVGFLNEALQRYGQPDAVLVPWRELIEGRTELSAHVQPGDLVRIESLGRDAAVEAALVGVGYVAERGELFFPARWYAGFCRVLAQLAATPCHFTSAPCEIITLFDKRATQQRFAEAGLTIPRSLGAHGSLPELAEAMSTLGVRQAFVKLAHGSSASGALAIRTDGKGRWKGYTTVEQVGGTLFNSRRIREIESTDALDSLLCALAPHTLHAEEWLPKASLQNSAFDLRALVIGGKLHHVVARLSQSPMTNLHLLNKRADAATVRERVGSAAWDALTELAERAAQCFPKCLHLGLDVMWLPGFRKLALLEAKAFGDLLPGTLHKGKTTYEAQLEALGFPC